MKKRLLCILMSLPMLLAAHGEVLTIYECVGLARDNYPAVAQYGLIEKMTRFNLQNASKAWLPQGSVSGQVSWQNDVAAWPRQFAEMLAGMGINFPGLDKTQYKIGIDLNQQIWDGGKVEANQSAIKTASEVEKNALDVQIYDVEGRVQDIYFAILLMDGKISSIDRTAQLVDSTLMQAKSLLRNGVAMQSDCDQIEAKLLALQQQSTQLTATRDSYRRVLEIFIGQPIGRRNLILPEEEPKPAEERPQLNLFDSQIRNVSSQEKAIKASLMPQIGAFATGYYGYPGFNMFKNMQNHDPSFNFMVGVKAAWNFGALYTRRNSLDKLQLQKQQIENNRKTFLFNNSIAETETDSKITSLREVMQKDEMILELRRRVIRSAQSQLRNGVIDATALLSKITDAELAENDLILHEIELTQAIYNLNHIKNR